MILDKYSVLPVLVLALTLAACARASEGTSSPQSTGKPIVVVTTSTLAALVQSVGDDLVTIDTLVPIGSSPETYEPAPSDVRELEHAALVVENGAGLEAWLGKLITSSATHAHLLVLSDVMPAPLRAINPHFWLDPNYAELYVAQIARALSQIDLSNASRYRANATSEISRLSDLDGWIRKRIATISPRQKTMITFHDAWYYFDKRYGIRDIGAIESSPGREPSAEELAALIATAKANNVRAIFAEPEYSPKLAKQLADSAGIKTVTDLYDDSLGQSPELQTYEGMMRHNVDTIVQAL